MNGTIDRVASAKDPLDSSTAEGVGSILRILSACEESEPSGQRAIAERVGVALGLANALIRRCVQKGFVKITEAPTRRYAYYLTPVGFSEKARLVAEYVSLSLDFFRRARGQFEQLAGDSAKRGWKRLILVGSGELAEIALLSVDGSGAKWVAVLDPQRNLPEFHGRRVIRDLSDSEGFDAVVIAESRDAQACYDELAKIVPLDRILVPSLLHVRTSTKS